MSEQADRIADAVNARAAWEAAKARMTPDEIAASGVVPYTPPSTGLGAPLLALIGEAPGAEEVEKGYGFAGAAGRLLDKMLEAAGIDRRACLIGNVFRIRPPGNDRKFFFIGPRAAKQDAVATAALPPWRGQLLRQAFAGEIAALQAALQQYRPAVIGALGDVATWALTGQSGITQLHGRDLPCTLAPEPSVVVPMYHPSYVLRARGALTDQAIADLRHAHGLLR